MLVKSIKNFRHPAYIFAVLTILFAVLVQANSTLKYTDAEKLEYGRRMYVEGIRPNGESMTAYIRGDIKLSGEQVICGTCHRRSGLGSSEGDQVVPGLTSELLYQPLTIPTSRPPDPPELRPAYTRSSIRQAIRHGVGADGQPLADLMPRYSLNDNELAMLLGYLDTLSSAPSPGVNETEVHFATIVTSSTPPAERDAMLAVLNTFIAQKNVETRHESKRASSGPWHKDWAFKSYRKWRLHVWELSGSADTWPQQLRTANAENPVFAVLSGLVNGSWRPVHEFCTAEKIPCLFPNTDLPVTESEDFYNVYFSQGVTLEARTIAKHLVDNADHRQRVMQVFQQGDIVGETAATTLQNALDNNVQDRMLPAGDVPATFWQEVVAAAGNFELVVWLTQEQQQGMWAQIQADGFANNIYLSSVLQKEHYEAVPASMRDRVYFARSYELPAALPKLLARSTGWFRAKRIYSPTEKRVQANTFFTLKVAGGAMAGIRGYFVRDYFLEKIEHMVDNASYTGVYPHVSMGPKQRFVSKGSYITQLSKSDPAVLIDVSGWLIPD